MIELGSKSLRIQKEGAYHIQSSARAEMSTLNHLGSNSANTTGALKLRAYNCRDELPLHHNAVLRPRVSSEAPISFEHAFSHPCLRLHHKVFSSARTFQVSEKYDPF